MLTRRNGFTLQELLVVVTIIIILFLLAIMALNPQTQLFKSRDAVRKSDIDRLRIAMENYYTDYDCYPTQDLINHCDGAELSPYLDNIPCDPLTKDPYHLEYIPSVCPQKYAILTNLEFTQDPSIARVGCTTGCGEEYNYNYAVTSGDATSATFTGTGTPTPSLTSYPTSTPTAPTTPTPPASYYCSNIDNCTTLPSGYTCPGYQLFDNSNCIEGARSCHNSSYVCSPELM